MPGLMISFADEQESEGHKASFFNLCTWGSPFHDGFILCSHGPEKLQDIIFLMVKDY